MRKIEESIVLPLVAALASCTPSARYIESDKIESDVRSAGTVTYSDLVKDAWAQMEDHVRSGPLDHSEEREVALVGVASRGIEELGDHRGTIDDALADKVSNSGLFVVVNRNMVRRVLQEMGSNDPNDLFLGNHRDAFVGQLAKGGITPGYLLFAEMSTASTTGKSTWLERGSKYRTYKLSLSLVNARTGEELVRSLAERTKEYYRS
ncbi:MAG: hypothetical protein R3F56_00345 [Planctomycetota bacterium]